MAILKRGIRPASRLNGAIRLASVLAAAVLLASCGAAPFSGEHFSSRDYGVAASPRGASGDWLPKGGGRYTVGKPYRVAGRTYIPRDDPNYTEVGNASWYGSAFHGRRTANGEVYDMGELTAAHPTLPLPSYVRVTNLANGRSIVVRINDRGPYARDRIIDVSATVAEILDFKRAGTTRVKVAYVGPANMDGDDRRMLMASYRAPGARDSDVAVAAKLPDGARVILASSPAPRAKRLPAVDFAIADPETGPDATRDDILAPLILRTGFASSYAPASVLTPAQSAAASLAASGSEAAVAAGKPRVVQLGSFADPGNAERAGRVFSRFGRVTNLERKSGDATLISVRLVIENPAISSNAVIAAAEHAGLAGAFLVTR